MQNFSLAPALAMSIPAPRAILLGDKPVHPAKAENVDIKPLLGKLLETNGGSVDQGLQPFQLILPDYIPDGKGAIRIEANLEGKTDENSDLVLLKHGGKRIIQWADDLGKDIAEVREFDPSDSGDSEEDDNDPSQHCTCVIQ